MFPFQLLMQFGVSQRIGMTALQIIVGTINYLLMATPIINGTSYHNIYMSGTWGPFCNNASYNSPSAAIREDASKHIFVYSYFDSLEHLLYDFNLSVGDTLPNPQPYSWNPYLPYENIIITNIDSVLVGTSYRKAFWCSDSTWMGSCSSSQCINYVALIEGIGSTYGLFGDLSPNWGEKDDILICFKLNGQDIYPVGQQCTLVPVGINELINSNNVLQVFPNPFGELKGLLKLFFMILLQESYCNKNLLTLLL
jgi:hypothetical protein